MKVEQMPVCVSFTSQTVDKSNIIQICKCNSCQNYRCLTYAYLLFVWVLILFFLCDAGDECLPQLYTDIKDACIVSLSGMV